jgi:hypothetical protein
MIAEKTRGCAQCGLPISLGRLRKPQTRYCSDKCRAKSTLDAYRLRNNISPLKLTTGKVGAIGELIVCADLLRRGYDVYRAVSQSAPFDIAILSGGQLRRIEVRTGQRLAGGGVTYAKNRIEADHVAVVVEGTVRFYEPELS